MAQEHSINFSNGIIPHHIFINKKKYIKTKESPYQNVVGNQGNGTWKIRLIYVGLPKLEFDLTSVDVSDTEWDAFGYNKLSAKPYKISVNILSFAKYLL